MFACEEGNLSIIDVFLAHEGFNVNAQNEVNLSDKYCVYMVESNYFLCDFKVFAFLLLQQDGVTGFMFAAINKQVAAVNKLLAHPQININMQDNVSVVLLTLFS